VAEKHPFLSPEWLVAARAIRDTMPPPEIPPTVTMRMNLVVTDTPFGHDVLGHIDTSDGEIIVEDGHLDGPDLTVTADYATARAVFVDLDATVAMQAFMGGRIKVDGDITKMLAMQVPGGEPDPETRAIAEAVRAITAD
jgi:hypothetical protein